MVEQEGTVTMNDVLARELALEEEAEAKLQENWGDENACTHGQGYITQPIFSCGTCVAKGKDKEPFGFCFGCSMNCHVDHDVFELFDKRHFKCDCGTPKSNCSCKFAEAPRLQNNAENKYTHNFQAKYCWCDSAYDPDSDIMSQCVVCEDWFHHTCVARRTQIPDLSTFKGFLCHLCTAKHPFFLRYPQLQPPSTSPFLSTSNSSSTTNSNSFTTTTASNDISSKVASSKAEDTKTETSTDSGSTIEESKINSPTTNQDKEAKQEASAKDNGTDHNKSTELQLCILQQQPAQGNTARVPGMIPDVIPDIFLIAGWRKGMCKCGSCVTMYAEQQLEWLLDDEDDPDEGEGEEEAEEGEEDEPQAYVEGVGEGRKRKISMLESAEQAFLENSQIPHSNKLNLITGFADMKTELKEFLRTFAESGRVVTEADIADFFEEFRKKRPRI